MEKAATITLSPQEEEKVIRSVEEAISHVNSGSSPNEAIQKVAESRQYGPEIIRRMAEAYNKSKTVHHFKQADADARVSLFDLADPSVIINSIYNKSLDKTAAAELQIPNRDFSKADFLSMQSAKMEKTASKEEPEENPFKGMTPASVHSYLDKQAAVAVAIDRKMYDRVLLEKRAFHKAIDRVVEQLLPLSDRQLQKTAQMVVNGYPESGDKWVKLITSRTRREIPAMKKTAHAVVFPSKEPYISISDMYKHAEQMAKMETDYAAFKKDAAGWAMTRALLGSKAMGIGAHAAESIADKKKDSSLIDELGPEAANAIKELSAKKNFYNLILYDEDLSQYEHSALVKAYNDAVQTVPQSYKNPAILKQLMMRNLESGGVKDIFEVSQEVQLAKGLTEMEEIKRRATVEGREDTGGGDKPKPIIPFDGAKKEPRKIFSKAIDTVIEREKEERQKDTK